MNDNIHHNLPHWNYFRLLERDLEDSFRYVHPCPDHYNTYSDHFARIILMACTEIENCLKDFAVAANYTPVPQNINQFFPCVSSKFKKFNLSKLLMPRYSLAFEPWIDWAENTPPEWWTYGYNKIKHDRLGHPNSPTLLRAILSVAALLTLLYHTYRLQHGQDCSMPFGEEPTLFEIDESDSDFEGGGIYFTWVLPDEKKKDA